MSAHDLAVMGATLADGGVNPVTGERVVDPSVCRYVLAALATSGLYEKSGDWLFSIGLPGKSGVSGGIVTVAPGKGSLSTFSPRLDEAGNSVRGYLATRYLSGALGLNLFASRPEGERRSAPATRLRLGPSAAPRDARPTGAPVTDTIDRLLDLDDDVRERPVVTRRPMHAPPPLYQPLSATVRYPAGPVPDVEDAVPESVPDRMPWRWPWQGVHVSVRLRMPVWHRSRVAAGLLGIFLGAFGLHRMYLGYWRRGLTMLAITVIGGFFTFGLAALAMGLWGFTEGLLVLSVRRGRFSHDARGAQLRG